MFCWNCGNEMNDDDAFCNNCGKPAVRDTGNMRQDFGKIMQVKKMSYAQKQIITLAVIAVVLFAVLVGIIMGIREPKNAKRENTKNIFTGITGPKRGDLLTEEEIENLDWELNMVVIDGKLLTFPLCEADMPDNVTIDHSEGEYSEMLFYYDYGEEVAYLGKQILARENGDCEPIEDCYFGIASHDWDEDGDLEDVFSQRIICPGGIHAGMSYGELLESLDYLKEELGVDYMRQDNDFFLYTSDYGPDEINAEIERTKDYEVEIDDSERFWITLDDDERYVESVSFADMTKRMIDLYE